MKGDVCLMRNLRVVSLVLAFLVLPLLPLLAATGPEKAGARRPAGAPPEVAQSRTLFYRLTSEQAGRAPGSLRFEVSVNGKPFVEEALTLKPVAIENAAYELLAKDPDTLGRIYTLAQDSATRVSITVSLDGAVVQELSFQEFLQYNAKLRQSRMQPQVASSKVNVLVPRVIPPGRAGSGPLPTKGVGPDPDCLAYCDEQYNFCVDNCDQRGSCVYCSDNYNNCYYSCPQVCTEPKSVHNVTSSEIVSVYYGYWTCFESVFENDFYDGQYYKDTQYNYKTTTVRRTEHCDGTHTDEVLSVTYSTAYCYTPTYITCYYPTAWAYNTCY